MSIDITLYPAAEITPEQITELIQQGASFKLTDIKEMRTVVRQVEQLIEVQGLSCRVYTEYRAAAMAGSLIPTGITQAIGLYSAIGIGIHNLFTYNPDYEIAKNELSKTITVIKK